MRRFTRRWHRIACSAGLAAVVGCGPSHPGRPSPTSHMQVTSRDEILKRGLAQKFRSRLGAAARQILAADSGSTRDPVVVVQIDPDTGSYALTREELDAGAVVGRFRKYSPGAIRRFGLGVKDDVSYWYVFLGKDGQYMGRFVSQSMDTTYAIIVEEHSEEEGFEKPIPWKQAIAQFEYLGPLGGDLRKKPRGDGGLLALAAEGGGGSVWMSCMALGCCKVQ